MLSLVTWRRAYAVGPEARIVAKFFQRVAIIAQLGERSTEDAEVACSIHADRIFVLLLNTSTRQMVVT